MKNSKKWKIFCNWCISMFFSIMLIRKLQIIFISIDKSYDHYIVKYSTYRFCIERLINVGYIVIDMVIVDVATSTGRIIIVDMMMRIIVFILLVQHHSSKHYGLLYKCFFLSDFHLIIIVHLLKSNLHFIVDNTLLYYFTFLF